MHRLLPSAFFCLQVVLTWASLRDRSTDFDNAAVTVYAVLSSQYATSAHARFTALPLLAHVLTWVNAMLLRFDWATLANYALGFCFPCLIVYSRVRGLFLFGVAGLYYAMLVMFVFVAFDLATGTRTGDLFTILAFKYNLLILHSLNGDVNYWRLAQKPLDLLFVATTFSYVFGYHYACQGNYSHCSLSVAVVCNVCKAASIAALVLKVRRLEHSVPAAHRPLRLPGHAPPPWPSQASPLLTVQSES